jgi:hypothetical protein
MSRSHTRIAISVALMSLLPAVAVAETPFSFDTGAPDGKMATATRPDAGGGFEIESADDFVLTTTTRIDSATFTGLLPAGAPLSDVGDVVVEIYRVSPKDSNADTNPGRADTSQLSLRHCIRGARQYERQPQCRPCRRVGDLHGC